MLHCAIVLLLSIWLIWTPALAQDPAETEQRLEQVRRQLQVIANQRRQLESQRGTAARQVRQVDEQVAATAHALRQTELQLDQQHRTLRDLNARHAALETRLAEQRDALATLLRAAYTEGESAPLKQLLAQDRVSDAVRAIAYHRYLQRHRQQRIAALQQERAEFIRLEAEIAERQHTLETTRAEQQRHMRTLERDRRTRVQTHARLDSQYADHSARERALGEDARALEQLLAALRVTAARHPATPSPVDPEPAGNAPSSSTDHQWRWPLTGQMIGEFNQLLADGRRSNGVLIAAAPGTQVHAIADGQVVFSDWMTGYGMLLIIDHANGYMSLYAHNESLYRQTGDPVRSGETIASVGNSGNQDTTALYFELRHLAQPINPSQWLRRE